jgi:recombinational DNA repair ATPase RecF
MQMIKIDGKDYDFDTLPTEAKAQFQSLQFVDAELARLGALVAVLKTARISYAKGLNVSLQAADDPLAKQLAGDTIKLG